MDIGHIRLDFHVHKPLNIGDMHDDPVVQFSHWFHEAVESKIAEPNGFVLSTVGVDGVPSQRSVLLKYYDQDGFVFYTNYTSRKAQEIKSCPQVSMLFPWYGLQRQVSIKGRVEKVSRQQTLRYFASRPRESQLGAWVSQQSKVIDSRALLMQQWQKMKQRFQDGEVPLPDFWGGYRIIPTEIEFWQGQPSRLHDRIVYQRQQEQWIKRRWSP